MIKLIFTIKWLKILIMHFYFYTNHMKNATKEVRIYFKCIKRNLFFVTKKQKIYLIF